MEAKRQPGFSGVGISSLLVIFAVLCLGVLALLTVSSVKADERLGDKTQAAVLDTYRAEAEAQKLLARLRNGEIPEGITGEGELYSYTCPISQVQALKVQVWVSGTEYEILRWQVVSTTQWQADDQLPVWQGAS